MMGRSHVLIGLAATGAAIAGGIEPLTPAVLIAAAAGSLAPDVDTPHSIAGRLLPFVSWPLYRTIGHRTATHSVIGLGGAGVLAAGLEGVAPLFTGISFLLGYTLHVAADLITQEGVALLYPFEKRRSRMWPRVRTGSSMELVVVLPIVAALLAATVHFAPRLADVPWWRDILSLRA